MIIAAAFVPSTPLLVPEVATGAAADLDIVRDASRRAVADALAADPERIVIVGTSSRVIGVPTPSGTRTYSAGRGSLRGFGVDLDMPLDPSTPSDQQISLSSSVGAWLLGRAGWAGERLAVELDPEADDAELDGVGAELAARPSTVLLVVADGSASRTEKAPASLHPDSAAFDASVASALASGDPARVAAIDDATARAVTSGGRPAWRAAAAALAATGPAYAAELLADEAPLGVGYLVARWTR